MRCMRRRRARGARLRHDGDERGLPDEAALAAHVWASDHQRARAPLRAPPALPLARLARAAGRAVGLRGFRAAPAAAGALLCAWRARSRVLRGLRAAAQAAVVGHDGRVGRQRVEHRVPPGGNNQLLRLVLVHKLRPHVPAARAAGGASLAGRSGALQGPTTAVTGCSRSCAAAAPTAAPSAAGAATARAKRRAARAAAAAPSSRNSVPRGASRGWQLRHLRVLLLRSLLQLLRLQRLLLRLLSLLGRRNQSVCGGSAGLCCWCLANGQPRQTMRAGGILRQPRS